MNISPIKNNILTFGSKKPNNYNKSAVLMPQGPDTVDFSMKKFSPVKVVEMPEIGQIAILADKVLIVSTDSKRILKQANAILEKVNPVIDEAKNEVSAFRDDSFQTNCPLILSEYSDDDCSKLTKQIITSDDGSITVYDYKNHTIAIKKDSNTTILAGVVFDFNHQVKQAREIFSFENDKLNKCASAIKEYDFEDGSYNADKAYMLDGDRITAVAFNYFNDCDNTFCAGHFIRFLDDNSFEFHKNYMTFEDSSISADVFYQFQDSKMINFKQDYTQQNNN